MASTEKQFYSYMYLREDGTPYYVGKGFGNRAYVSSGRTFHPPKNKSRILIFPMLNEVEAFESEIALIELFGRKDNGTGILRNLTDGGDGASGHIKSEENRRKLSEAARNKSEEHRRKVSDALRGRPLSEEHRHKLSKAHRGKPLSEEHRHKLSEVLRGRVNSEDTLLKMSIYAMFRPAYGRRVLSEEARRNLSEAQRGKVRSEDTRLKMSIYAMFRPAYKAARLREANKK